MTINGLTGSTGIPWGRPSSVDPVAQAHLVQQPDQEHEPWEPEQMPFLLPPEGLTPEIETLGDVGTIPNGGGGGSGGGGNIPFHWPPGGWTSSPPGLGAVPSSWWWSWWGPRGFGAIFELRRHRKALDALDLDEDVGGKEWWEEVWGELEEQLLTFSTPPKPTDTPVTGTSHFLESLKVSHKQRQWSLAKEPLIALFNAVAKLSRAGASTRGSSPSVSVMLASDKMKVLSDKFKSCSIDLEDLVRALVGLGRDEYHEDAKAANLTDGVSLLLHASLAAKAVAEEASGAGPAPVVIDNR